MNDFPGLTPPPARDLTPEQRERIRAALPLDHPDDRVRPWWVTGVAAAAAVLAVIGGAVALSRSIGSDGTPRQVGPAGHGSPGLPKPSAFCPSDGCTHTTGPGVQADSLNFISSAGGICIQGAPRTFVVFAQAKPIRDAALTGAELEHAHGVVLGRTWIAVKPRHDVASAGTFDPTASGTDTKLERMWRNRKPLAGAHLAKGTTYTFFAEITIAPGGRTSGIGYAYTDAMSPGITVVPSDLHAATNCS